MSAVRASISVALKGSGANGLPDRADPQRLCRAEPIPRGSACRSGALLPRRTADDHCQRHPAQTVSRSIAGCQEDFFQNGDLDFDGSSYISDWPDGSPDHPTSLAYIGPFTNGSNTYPQIQFETNGPASEILCNVVTGAARCRQLARAVPPSTRSGLSGTARRAARGTSGTSSRARRC